MKFYNYMMSKLSSQTMSTEHEPRNVYESHIIGLSESIKWSLMMSTRETWTNKHLLKCTSGAMQVSSASSFWFETYILCHVHKHNVYNSQSNLGLILGNVLSQIPFPRVTVSTTSVVSNTDILKSDLWWRVCFILI